MNELKEVIEKGNELIKFNSEKVEFIKDMVANVNGYNYSIKAIEEFINKFAWYNKDTTKYQINQIKEYTNQHGNSSSIVTNCFKYPHEFEVMTIEEFKEEFEYFLFVAIDNSEELTNLKDIANSCGNYKMPLYEEAMPNSLKLAIFQKLEEKGILNAGAKEEFLQLLEGCKSIANKYEFDQTIFEEEDIKNYSCYLEFDILELNAFGLDALTIGIIEDILFELAISEGYKEEELKAIGIIGICHLLEYCHGKRYFSSFKRSCFGMPLK